MNAMRTVAVRNLRAHKMRLLLTLVSVLLGTAFVAGSFVFTDTLKQSFNTIFATSDKGIDAQVRPRHDFAAGVPTALAAKIAEVPGVRAVQPQIGTSVAVVGPDGKKIDTGGAPSQGGAWQSTRAVQAPPKLVRGSAPNGRGQVAVNDSAADQNHLKLGDRIKVVVPNSAVATARIVGIYRVSFDTGGYIGALFSRDGGDVAVHRRPSLLAHRRRRRQRRVGADGHRPHRPPPARRPAGTHR